MGMFDNEVNNSPDSTATETVEIDLNAVIEADNPDADFNERTAPPTGGLVYAIQWELDEKGCVPAMTKNHTPFVHLYLKGKLTTSGNFENYPVSCYLNSIVFGSKGTSEVHHFLSVLGESVPQRIPLGELKDRVETILAQNPVGLALCDWRAAFQDGINPKTGKAKYTDIKSGMRNFPKVKNLETGEMEYQFILQHPKDGTDVIARFEVVKHVSSTEVKKENLTMAS